MIKACILDIDGTLYQGQQVIAGAPEAIQKLRGLGLRLLFATNTTRFPRSHIIAMLGDMGIEVETSELLTAPLAASIWLSRRGARRLSLLLNPATINDFSQFEIDEDSPEYVVIGDLGRRWDFEIMNRAFRALQSGAGLVAIQKNRWWNDGSGALLDAGPFVVALEYATSTEAVLVGKPSQAFYESAVSSLAMNMDEILVVGDSVENDIWGAHEFGLEAVAVRTGSFDATLLKSRSRQPETVLASIADLPDYLETRSLR